jgi:hypothetical protein
VNYFRGGTHLQAHVKAATGLPSYRVVTYRNLWPGIDLRFRGGSGLLKYELLVRPGGDPSAVQLALQGAQGLSLGPAGTLLVRTSLGTLKDAAPLTYQTIAGRRIARESRFRLMGRSGYGFDVSSYDRRRPLVIDPGLAYSTFLGGSRHEFLGAWGVTVDGDGNAYVTGATASPDFPTTPGAFDQTFNGDNDVFVTKLNPAGTAVLWSTFIGGASYDAPDRPVLDKDGNVWVAGVASGNGFPTTPGSLSQTPHGGGGGDAFVLKLDPTGSTLLYSAMFGGSDFDGAGEMALDANGRVYVSGTTRSRDFPITAGAYQTSFNRGGTSAFNDDFVARLSADGTRLEYSTYLGGSDEDQFRGLAIDPEGNAYVAGFSYSSDFPTTPGAVQRTFGGYYTATVSKLDASGSNLIYSTYLGAGGGAATGIKVDPAGNAFVTGYTPGGFPTTAGAYQTVNGGLDAFVAKLKPDGSLDYSTYLGGGEYDQGLDIAIDGTGQAYVAGRTQSTDFPTTPNGYDRTFNGGFYDPFLSVLNPSGTTLAYSTYLGGGGYRYSTFSYPNTVAIDRHGDAYLAGYTEATDFPTTPGAYDTHLDGENDGFVAKLELPAGPASSLILSPKTATNTVGAQHCVSASVKDAFERPTPNVTVSFTVTGSVTRSGSQQTTPSGTATFCYQGPDLPGSDDITAFTDTNGNGTRDAAEPQDTAQKTWSPPASSSRCKIEGSGRMVDTQGDRGDFRIDVKTTHGEATGRLYYTDRGPGRTFSLRSVRIGAVVCSGREGSLFGEATVDGSELQFRVDATDGHKHKGDDTFRLLLGDGYDSGKQGLVRGDLKIRSG